MVNKRPIESTTNMHVNKGTPIYAYADTWLPLKAYTYTTGPLAHTLKLVSKIVSMYS